MSAATDARPTPATDSTRASSGPRRSRSKGATKRAPWILLAPFLALFVLTFMIPIVIAVFSSFTSVTRAGLFGEGGVTSGFAGFDNYAQVLGDGNFLASIGRMLLFGVVQVPVMLILCTVLALLLESASAKWPGVFRAAYFLPYGVPGVIATILWSFLYVPGLSPIIDIGEVVGLSPDFLGADTVLWSIANIVTWSYTGYNMLIIIAQLKSIPVELYEAAKVDGASPLRVAVSIQLPLIRPALLLTAVFSIIGTLQLFAEAQVLQRVAPAIDSQYTPNLSAYTTAFAYNDYNVAAAQSVLIALVAFALSITFLSITNRKSA
ncbi:carbohydrate ABC transporter permease [Frigoribacterium faeni]|uniref:Multiple sugar transport system permease protein n=1 Tax=Frigoribacterium faeni TaxID=145483 RepID=A0A7W3JHS7_9MICO|nr:sugar ABC transporter permease [Frigoribacterium faeni]MBA8813068.1 multiple sugar transport system permease protein [Frigoribacterium faeni]BFF14247.1 sugar ABC transporter permease [Microbacterium flavescens]GEK84010.1 sugar ABC transporter permease [Frigoribacterium faeni]